MKQDILVKEKVNHLKGIIDSLSSDEIKLIFRGERPKRIEQEDFKVLRKSYNDNVKRYLNKEQNKETT
jgi:hypothetical protein